MDVNLSLRFLNCTVPFLRLSYSNRGAGLIVRGILKQIGIIGVATASCWLAYLTAGMVVTMLPSGLLAAFSDVEGLRFRACFGQGNPH